MKKRKISDAVVRRLPRYYRYLDDLHSKGIVRISSSLLGERMGITASQIRQDLSCFGEFGQQDRKSTRLNSSHKVQSRMPSSA